MKLKRAAQAISGQCIAVSFVIHNLLNIFQCLLCVAISRNDYRTSLRGRKNPSTRSWVQIRMKEWHSKSVREESLPQDGTRLPAEHPKGSSLKTLREKSSTGWNASTSKGLDPVQFEKPHQLLSFYIECSVRQEQAMLNCWKRNPVTTLYFAGSHEAFAA